MYLHHHLQLPLISGSRNGVPQKMLVPTDKQYREYPAISSREIALETVVKQQPKRLIAIAGLKL
jgi:hypothetical protein